RRPGTDQVQGPELRRTAAPQCLAVNGHVLDRQRGADGFHPLPETGLESLRVEPVEDALERVVRRNAVGQTQEAAQPIPASLAERGDLLPVLRSGDDGTQGDNEDVLEAMQPAVASAGIFYNAEVLGDRQVCNRSLLAVPKG